MPIPELRPKSTRQSEAIAMCLHEFTVARVPIVATVIGEGGSGGALALAIADRVLMLEHSIYSVASPEGCAAILWSDATKAEEAAQRLKLTAQDLQRFGIVDDIVPEPLGGAHRDTNAVVTARLGRRFLLRWRSSCRYRPGSCSTAAMTSGARSVSGKPKHYRSERWREASSPARRFVAWLGRVGAACIAVAVLALAGIQFARIVART